MSWAARVRDAFAADEDQKRLHTALLGIHAALLGSQARLALHSQQAPSESSASALGELAAAVGASAAILRTALHERAVSLLRVSTAPEQPPSVNHWARVVADYEDMRNVQDLILKCMARFADGDEGATALLYSLLERAEAHGAMLRREIARADPQAIN